MSSIGTQFPATPIGLSSNLKYDLPPSLSESANSKYIQIQPTNVAFVDQTTTYAPFVNNAVLPQTLFNQQNLIFDLAGSGSSPSLFLDTENTHLTFTMELTVTTAAAGLTNPVVNNIIGSASSFFSQLQLLSSQLPLETITAYDQLAHFLLQYTLPGSNRQGASSIQLGTDVPSGITNTGSYTGIDLPTTAGAGTYYFTFSIPLISMIGVNCAREGKLFPYGLAPLQLIMTTNQYLPIVSSNGGATTAGVWRWRMSNIKLNLKLVDIGEAAGALWLSQFPDNKVFLKGSTWSQSNVALPNNSSGQLSLFHQVRNSSVKSAFFLYTMTGNLTLAPNQYYDSLNPALTQWNMNALSTYPQFVLNPSYYPSQAFAQLAAAFGRAGDWISSGGSIFRQQYGSSTAVPVGSDNMMVVPNAGNTRPTSGTNNTATDYPPIQFPSAFALGIDCEKSSGVLFSGISTRLSGIQQTFNIATAITTAMQAVCFGYVDMVMVFDIGSRSIYSFV